MYTTTTEHHDIKAGDELNGDGIRVYVDGDDMTHRLLDHIGPPKTNGYGMRIPRGEAYAAITMSHLLESGRIQKT